MADINLTQEDADALLAMEKHKADDAVYEYPSLGGGIRVPLLSPDKRVHSRLVEPKEESRRCHLSPENSPTKPPVRTARPVPLS